MGGRSGDRILSRAYGNCRLHVTFLADSNKLRNQLSRQAFYISMNFDRPLRSRTEDVMKRLVSWSDLPPAQAGLSVALRRAFAAPEDDCSREFEDLLRKLA